MFTPIALVGVIGSSEDMLEIDLTDGEAERVGGCSEWAERRGSRAGRAGAMRCRFLERIGEDPIIRANRRACFKGGSPCIFWKAGRFYQNAGKCLRIRSKIVRFSRDLAERSLIREQGGSVLLAGRGQRFWSNRMRQSETRC